MKIFLRSLNLLALFLVSQIWTIVISIFAGPSLVAGTPFKPSLLVQGIVVLSAIFSVWLTWYLAKKTEIPQPNIQNWSLKDTGIAIGVTILTRSLARLGIYLLQQGGLEGTANDANLALLFEHFNFFPLFILVAICGPILEEWVFRAGIIGHLFKKYPLIGVLISSLIFGALHSPTNWISWFIYGGIGAILSLIYAKTKRLELVMAIHILHNAFSFWL